MTRRRVLTFLLTLLGLPKDTIGILASPKPPADSGRPKPVSLDIVEGFSQLNLYRDRKGWTGVLSRANDVSGETRKRFSVAQRDQQVARLAETIQKSPDRTNLRCLILEHVEESGGFGGWARYRAVAIQGALGQVKEKLPAVAGIRTFKARTSAWGNLDRSLKILVKNGGGNNGIRFMFDAGDSLLISYFDGERWWVASWFWFGHYLEVKAGFDPKQLSREAKALGELFVDLEAAVDAPKDSLEIMPYIWLLAENIRWELSEKQKEGKKR